MFVLNFGDFLIAKEIRTRTGVYWLRMENLSRTAPTERRRMLLKDCWKISHKLLNTAVDFAQVTIP